MIDKPVQTKITRDNSNDDLLDALDNARWHIREAMDELRGFDELSDWFDALDDIDDEMQPMYEQCEQVAANEYAEEMDGLRRQYYRSVI